MNDLFDFVYDTYNTGGGTQLLNALVKGGIDSLEKFEREPLENLKAIRGIGAVGCKRLENLKHQLEDPKVIVKYSKSFAIDYRIPFKSSEEFGKWINKADNDFVDACETCPIAKVCNLSCDIEVALGIEDETIGCSKLYDILLSKFGDKED